MGGEVGQFQCPYARFGKPNAVHGCEGRSQRILMLCERPRKGQGFGETALNIAVMKSPMSSCEMNPSSSAQCSMICSC